MKKTVIGIMLSGLLLTALTVHAQPEDTPPAPNEIIASQDAEQVLVDGEPPLTVGIVDNVMSFFEWVLDATLTEQQRLEMKTSLIESWTANNPDEIGMVVEILNFYQQLMQLSEADRAAYQLIVSDEMIEQARKTPEDEGNAWILNVWDNSHQPIAEGTPPLTRQITNAYAEMLTFMVATVLDRDDLSPDQEFYDGIANDMSAQWVEMTPEKQAEMANIPYEWALLRTLWPQLPEENRQNLKTQWAESLTPMLPQPEPEVAEQTPPAPQPATTQPGEPLQLASEDADGYEARAKAYFDAGRYDEALADYNESIRLSPRRVSAFIGRGAVLEKKDASDQATNDYLHATQLDPKSDVAYEALFNVYWGKDNDLARKYWNKFRIIRGEDASDDGWSLYATARLQADNMRFQVMSNVLRMQHETNMTIINNIGGWSTIWRYNY